MTDHTAWVSDIDVPKPSGIHDFAKLYPPMSDVEYATLEADIAAHSQLEPITLMPDGKILDGCHRAKVCLNLAVEPHSVVFKGSDGQASEDDALSFVRSKNSAHRHLTTSQRAMVAARMRKFAHLACTTAARALEHSVSKRTVEHADKVLDSGDAQLIEEVDKGMLTVSAAANKIDVVEAKRRRWAEEEQRNQARIEAAAHAPKIPPKQSEPYTLSPIGMGRTSGPSKEAQRTQAPIEGGSNRSEASPPKAYETLSFHDLMNDSSELDPSEDSPPKAPETLSFDDLMNDSSELDPSEDGAGPYPQPRCHPPGSLRGEQPTVAAPGFRSDADEPSIATLPNVLRPATPLISDEILAATEGLPDRDGVRFAAHYIEATEHGSESALYLFHEAAKRVSVQELEGAQNKRLDGVDRG
jgi:hypothetical protein